MWYSESIFCCTDAVPISAIGNEKLHNDPIREVHDAIFKSFINFTHRWQIVATLMSLIRGLSSDSSSSTFSSPIPSTLYTPPQEFPTPILTPEALRNNPITPNTPYVIHLTSRHDFGPVFAHRYFVCPSNLQHDWIEASLEQWFAEGAQFNLKAEKWDVKCMKDYKFYRLTLRPNLAMRFHPQESGMAQGQ